MEDIQRVSKQVKLEVGCFSSRVILLAIHRVIQHDRIKYFPCLVNKYHPRQDISLVDLTKRCGIEMLIEQERIDYHTNNHDKNWSFFLMIGINTDGSYVPVWISNKCQISS